MTDFATADLTDEFADRLRIVTPGFMDFGGSPRFCGPIETVQAYEDNTFVRQTLETPGEGRVLVVDGAGSMKCALLGDRLGELAVKNSWVGVIVHGAIRDKKALSNMPIGVKALGTHPLKSHKAGRGGRGMELFFHGTRFQPGNFIYCDEDGMVLAEEKLI